MRRPVACILILLAAGAQARADVGEPAHHEVARVQSTSEQFRASAIERGAVSQPHSERWKFTRRDGDEQWIFTVDGDTRNGLVVRETYIREIIEADARRHGSPDRFEWRSFRLQTLPQAIAAARKCDNGEDCAAWF